MMPRTMTLRIAGLVLAVGSLVGCGDAGGTRSTSTTARQPPAATAAEPKPPAPPPARTVRFTAADGKRVTARYTPAGKRAPAVVLLHEIRGGPDQWQALIPYLHAAGFATLAYQSRASVLERQRVRDTVGAVQWLRARTDVDARRIALVGASIGASTTVLAMATSVGRRVAAAVALSPPDSADIWALQGKDAYRPHDVLLVSDAREASSVEGMIDGAVRSKALRSSRPGHGVALLAEPGIRRALLAWLDERARR
jgi:BAAT / Acyl-CoA thioester hydrolase C terminal